MCLLKDSVVDRDIGALGKETTDELLFARGSVVPVCFVKYRGQGRQVLIEGSMYCLDIPGEHTTVPEELSTLVEDLRHIPVGLLGERLYLDEVILTNITNLDVSIASLRA